MTTQLDDKPTYSIMEAAKLSGLPESTLRYYETIGLIEGIKRGATNKQREYTDADITMVIAVACLSATGMSIDHMRSYLGNRARGAVAASEQITLLVQQRTRLAEEARFMQLRQRYVEVKIAYWKAVEAGDNNAVAATMDMAESTASELKLSREHT